MISTTALDPSPTTRRNASPDTSASGDSTPPPSPADLAGRTYADFATDTLRDRLITLEIEPGSPLNDEQIGRELGVGRTPVREAIKRLESEHLVAVYPRRGTFAAGVDITDLAHITEIRMHLEPVAADRAAHHATLEDRANMRRLRAALAELELDDLTPAELMRFDLEVHRLIYASTGNPHLAETLTRFDNLATRIWCQVIERLPEIDSHIAEHIQLLTLIADGDATTAAHTARDHVIAFEQLVRSAI